MYIFCRDRMTNYSPKTNGTIKNIFLFFLIRKLCLHSSWIKKIIRPCWQFFFFTYEENSKCFSYLELEIKIISFKVLDSVLREIKLLQLKHKKAPLPPSKNPVWLMTWFHTCLNSKLSNQWSQTDPVLLLQFFFLFALIMSCQVLDHRVS